ncbi:MAG TPA: ABC transporter permease [Pseudoflavonifractor sp.]|nr:ABC transporter permease [Pseudoflavonifractor sp.]
MEGKRLKNPLEKQGIQSALASIIAIIIGMLVGFIILLVSNPGKALSGFVAIATGGFSDMKQVGQVLYYATPLIMTGLSVGFAKKTGLFNIGGPGQFIMGAFAAVYVGVRWTFLPAGLHCLVALLAAVLVGGLWGAVPGILKAYYNINEVIACIMMNYIGMSMSNLLIRRTVFDVKTNLSLRPAASAVLPKLGFDKIFVAGATPSSVNSGILIAILMGILVWVVLEKTKFGFELKACGYNRDAAKYAGINEKKNIMLSMIIAGALCGLGGALLYLAGAGTGIPVLDVLAVQGFNGIPVALLGMSNPIAIIFTGIFMSYLTVGGLAMQLYGFVSQIVDIITSVIIYFAAFALFFSQIIAKMVKGKQEKNANAAPPAPPGLKLETKPVSVPEGGDAQ